jgi:hypothetical protein
MSSGLEPVADVSAGDWIAGRLGGPVGTVGWVVPRGFPAYARVLHPVEGGEALTWAQVCQRTGRIPHALMQWTAIAPEHSWTGGTPRVGHLEPAALRALTGVLTPATGGQECFHALWDGWGWIDGAGWRALTTHGRAEPTLEPGVAADVRAIPRLRLPLRDYLLYRGPLTAAARLGWHDSAFGFEPQSPSLLWPADHTWCVATEIDFDSTLVGGPADLIGAVLAAPGLDAWPIEPDADLTKFADLLNSVP